MGSLHWERLYPFLFAFIAVPISWYFDFSIKKDQDLLLSSSITFGAIVYGFVGTSLSILTSLGTKVMSKIRETNYLFTLKEYLGWGLLSGMIVCCVSMFGLLKNAYECLFFTSIWFGAIVLCLACLFRLSNLMLQIFSHRENRPRE